MFINSNVYKIIYQLPLFSYQSMLTHFPNFQYEGFILYRTKLTEDLKDTITLNIATLRDRAMVMVDSVSYYKLMQHFVF